MIRKCFSFCLAILMLSLTVLPTLADGVLVHANNAIVISFVDSLNLNKSEAGDTIRFRLDDSFSDADGDFLPANTMFYGNIDSLTKSKIGFRKAKANISINKMVFPDGREYYIQASSNRKTLTSSTTANIAKGVVTSTAAAGVCMVGAIVIAIETLSVAGLIFAPYTGAAVGVALATTSKGVNCKIPVGTKIAIKFDRALNIPDGM